MKNFLCELIVNNLQVDYMEIVEESDEKAFEYAEKRFTNVYPHLIGTGRVILIHELKRD